MTKVWEGQIYRLDGVMDIPGYQGFILMNGSLLEPDYAVIDLGHRRILELHCSNSYLILVSNHAIRVQEISGKNNKLSRMLAGMGIRAKTNAGYSKGKNAWHYAIGKGPACSMKGIFSKYGYAVQDRIWADCWEYDFKMSLFNPGWVKIGGVDTNWFTTPNWVLDDVIGKGSDLIRKALTEPVDISEEKFRKALKKAGLDESLFMD